MVQTMSEFDLEGINVQKTNTGFVIKLTGNTYKIIGEKINNGQITKEFYHQLKLFIKELAKIAEQKK
jgi:hypothetical protein